MSDTNPEKPTTRAVVKYAERLRAQADKQMAADPYASPYYPTTAAAQQLVKRLARSREQEVRDCHPHLVGTPELDELVAQARAEAPALAIEHLRRRAAVIDGDHRRDETESHRALQRHQRRKAQHARDVAALRAERTLGARLDTALGGLATVAAASAAVIGGDRVQGGEKSQQPPWTGDPHGYARDRAHRLVQHLEELLEDARARDVKKAA